MQFKLSKKGTVTECREALNSAIAALPLPYNTEHAVVRAIANHVVVTHLDPLHDPWADENNKRRAAGIKPADEPTASFSIDCTITTGA